MAWEFDVPQISKGLLLKIGKKIEIEFFPIFSIYNIKYVMLKLCYKIYQKNTNFTQTNRARVAQNKG